MWFQQALFVFPLIAMSRTAPYCGGRSALIFLQGLASDSSLSPVLSFTRNVVRSRTSSIDHAGGVVEWFKGPKNQMQDDLDEALEKIEKEEIEYLIYEEGICPEDIVVAGMSQGGALTIWMALFSKYKLGGFIPMNIYSSEWLQLEDLQIPEKPVNQWTPILHLNGKIDDQTKKFDATGKAFIENIFTNYEFRHVTIFNALVKDGMDYIQTIQCQVN